MNNNNTPPAVSPFAIFIFLAAAGLTAFSVSYPLLGSLGAESGLLFGVVIGPIAYLSGVIRGAYRDRKGFSGDAVHELCVVYLALLLFAFILVINAYFVASCAPARGLLPFAIHAIPVVTFDSICGLLIGRLVGRRFWAFVLALFFFAGYFVFNAWHWWQLPNFRILSHPLVAIDGDLWGGAGLSSSVVAFRAATFFFAMALLFTGMIKGKSIRRGPLLGAVFFFALGGITHFGVVDRLEPSKAERSLELSQLTRRGQFILHSDPKATTPKEAEAMLAEANLWGARLRTRMGELSAEPIHIWLYPNFEALNRFTGAVNVHFALPKQREVHITGSEVPHPTLGHEIAHVFIGEKATTFLGVPGVLGFLPNQGLSEGLAMMLTPELSIKNELTLNEQAAALMQAGKMPKLKALFAVSPLAFFAHNASMAYSVAGAYLEDLVAKQVGEKEKHALIGKLAAQGRIDDDFKTFIQSLKQVALPSDAIASVNTLFSAAPVLSSTCSDITPLLSAQQNQLKLEQDGDAAWRDRKYEEAANLWRQINLEILPPLLQRAPQAKKILAVNPRSELSKNALDYLVFTQQPGVKSIAAAMNLSTAVERRLAPPDGGRPTAAQALSQYLALRPRVLATGAEQDLAALELLVATQTLPLLFELESARSIGMARALGPLAKSAAIQFRQLSAQNPRAATRLEMLDDAQRSELIANALNLNTDDPIKGDIWLLGIERPLQ